MKKIILTILMTAMAPVFAQTAVVVPTSPTIAATSTISPNAASALALSTTNSVFVDQAGDNVKVNITQFGSGNKQGTGTRPVYLHGIDQDVTTVQTGDNNSIMFEGVNDSTGAGVGLKVTIQQTGTGNTVDAACGYGLSSTGATALTGCKAADLNWKFTGDSNALQFRATGNDIKSAITVTGNSNYINADMIGDKHSETLMIAGDNNTFNTSQRSVSSAGSSIWVDLNGTGNRFTVSQSGTIDNVINIKSQGSAGTWNIVQKN